MAELPAVTPEYFQILVLRELRKAGFDLGQPRVHRRSELPEPERGFVLELVIPLGGAGARRRALIVCLNQLGVVGPDVVASAKARLADASADVVIVFATAEFAPEALTAAHESGVALLRIVDGRSAFDMSGWSTPGHYPAWLPAYLPQVIDRDIAGLPRAQLLEAGRADMILDRLAPRE
jgi:hypothetical protein